MLRLFRPLLAIVDRECFMLYKYRPPALVSQPTPQSMPQLDFREALSTPDEKLLSPAATITPVSGAPLNYKRSPFARGVQLSRSTLTNIFFVAIASFGGLVCAFYFFNGGELLRAAAAWPSEFLYPRPPLTERIDVGEQPNPIDKFANGGTESTKTDEARVPSEKDTGPADFSQPANTIGASNPTAGAGPVGSVAPLLPNTPFLPDTPSIPGVQTPPAPDIGSLFQPIDLQPLYQIATSAVPKSTTTTRTVKSTRATTRRKVSGTRQTVAGQTKSSTSVTKSTSENVQQMSNQIQMPMNSIQAPSQMMSGGLGGGVGGAVGGVGGGLGGGLGGVGGPVGGVLGGHH